MHSAQTTQGALPSAPPGNRPDRPVVAFVLTLLGDLSYLPWGLGFFIGGTGTGSVPLQFSVLFGSTLGVLACAVMMMVRPRGHVVWGVLVLLASFLAIAIDGYILVNLLTGGTAGASPVGGAIGVAIGVAITSAIFIVPLGLIIIGGILAITWKPPVPRT